MANPDKPKFVFDPRSQKYRNLENGQYVAQSVVNPYLLEGYIEKRQDDFQKVTQALLDGSISVSSWESAVANELKSSHIVSYSLGRGGTKRLSSRDYGIIGARLRGEYSYLRGFSEDILAGKLSENQIRYRMSLYLEGLHTTYELARLESHRASGFRWEKWNRSAKESCDDCIEESNKGWIPIGGRTRRPGIGVACKSNCRCSVDYSAEITKPTERLLASRFGWI